MILRRSLDNGKVKVRFATALILVAFLFNSFGFAFNSTSVYAEPPDQSQTSTEEETQNENPNDGEETEEQGQQQEQVSSNEKKTDGCKDSLGALGWLVCPFTGVIATATDSLYNLIDRFLQIDPISNEEDSAILRAWEYARFFTNAVFIIFFMVLIYSQVTGFGISNYGIKKALPKIFVVAILINLSFLICVLAIDVSNILGNGIRGLFSSIEEGILNSTEVAVNDGVSLSGIYTAIVGGASLSVAGVAIAVESGAIWMLIPMVLGALVSVASGLLTLGLRQAVVTLLVMVSPLAFVAYMLPNTEKWFTKWKNLLLQMLIFFPMFSLLIGASHLAGFAILIASKDFLGAILGVAVQILPLFFSVKLMKMSDTFLGAVSAKIQGLTAAPLAVNRAWADSHRQFARQKTLASGFTPSARLVQFLSDRKVAREEEIGELASYSKLRGQAYGVRRNYDSRGVPTAEGEAAYKRQALSMTYTLDMERHKNNMNKGLGGLETVKMNAGVIKRARLEALDVENVVASDKLKMEASRGEKIDYENARGFHKRMEDAINVHFDDMNAGKKDYKMHEMKDRDFARGQYNAIVETMEGDVQGIHYAAAMAAQGYDTQKKIVETKMQKYFELTPPTKDVEFRLSELTKGKDAIDNVDSIISGLRVLNQRGDTDLVKKHMEELLAHKVQLGTHASQALASFLMFDVKDSDPWLRRFGKYINLETANVYNKNRRKVMEVDYDEYVRGYHDEPDADNAGATKRMYAKKGMKELMEGTSLDGIERTALDNYNNSLIKAYTGPDGKINYREYKKKREEVDTAIAPAFIAASLKWPSGSEQITSAVRFMTGYRTVQKEDGTFEMKPLWEGDDKDANEYKKLFAGHIGDIRKWYQGRTIKYLEDQTPFQILGLRSDYKVPLFEHLVDAYLNNTAMDGWSDEAKEERRDIMNDWAELQTKYGDLSTEEARKNYSAEANVLKNKMVGAQFRQVLDSKGKLNQIYRTRRSGNANNAKDWVRDWLDLGNELQIQRKLKRDGDREKEEFKKIKQEKANKSSSSSSDVDVGVGVSGGGYTETDRAYFSSYVDNLWNNMRGNEDEFFDESLKYVNEVLGENSYISLSYKKYRKDDPYAGPDVMKEYLMDLLSDLGNYNI